MDVIASETQTREPLSRSTVSHGLTTTTELALFLATGHSSTRVSRILSWRLPRGGLGPMEISLEASWVGVQRHGQDLADRLAQGFSGLLHAHPPQLLPWSPLVPPKLVIPFEIDLPVVPFVGGVRSGGRRVVDLPAVAVSSLVEIGGRLGQVGSELGGYVVGGGFVNLPSVAVSSLVEMGGRLGQAGSELGGYVGGAVEQIAELVPVPFRAEGARRRKWEAAHLPPASADEGDVALGVEAMGRKRIALEGVGNRESLEVAATAAAAATGSAVAASASGIGAGDDDGLDEEEDEFECEIGTLGNLKKAKVCTIDLVISSILSCLNGHDSAYSLLDSKWCLHIRRWCNNLKAKSIHSIEGLGTFSLA
jgi:hypothetical protein